MFLLYLSVKSLICVHAQSPALFQLSPPQVQIDSVFFLAKATVKLALDYPETEIRYTVDSGEVTTLSPLYRQPLVFPASAEIRAKAFHPRLQASEEVHLKLWQLPGNRPRTYWSSEPPPDPGYSAKGLQSLSDGQKGGLNFAAEDHRWLGWQVDTLHLTLTFAEAIPLEKISFSLLENHGAWIFAPEQIIVYHHGQQIGSRTSPVPGQAATPAFRLVTIPLNPGAYQGLDLQMIASALPDWHEGAGQPAWIFLDEIIPVQKK